eukprot:COSAG06_NODE_54666_length_293_cov_1.046392_1_plen_64_part_10
MLTTAMLTRLRAAAAAAAAIVSRALGRVHHARPGWDVEGGEDAQFVNGHCFYFTHTGRRFPGDH